MDTIGTDYLVVGGGAMGMAFADMLVTHSDATIVLVDRRHAPGGHWVDAYPFVRLHMPSAFYGVDSVPLGGYGPDETEDDPTLLERATGEEIQTYYADVLGRLLGTGRVRWLPGTEYLGNDRARSLDGDAEVDIRHRRLVDATRMEGAIPATSPPPFEVADGATCIPVGDLPDAPEPPDGYVVVGAGKTGQDAILWLLERGVAPDLIEWVRPREPWLQPRRSFQPGPGVVDTIDFFSRSVEAAAEAASPAELFDRVEEYGGLHRIDPDAPATVYRGALVSDRQLAELRRVDRVVRRGYVRRVEPDAIVFDDGRLRSTPGTLVVHCAAQGLATRRTVPVFDGRQINLQPLRYGSVPFSASLTGFVEAHRDDDEAKNALCRPMPLTGGARDYLVQIATELDVGRRWAAEPDLSGWLDTTHLNLAGALPDHADDPRVAAARARVGAQAGRAMEHLRAWLAA